MWTKYVKKSIENLFRSILAYFLTIVTFMNLFGTSGFDIPIWGEIASIVLFLFIIYPDPLIKMMGLGKLLSERNSEY